MLRRSNIALGGYVMKKFGDFHIREHLLQNYEGWRVLDNPKYETQYDFWVRDSYGYCRHIDPIIDDPRLTHKQRVCRLYKWAMLELRQFQIENNRYKGNIGVKVIRHRFEKYRYVTDPATCDMMVRETQKYLRDQCYWWFFKQNASDKYGPAHHTWGMSHPDNSLVYDHWVNIEVQQIDDAKLHRFSSHHPIYSGPGEMADRFGDNETLQPGHRIFMFFFCFVFLIYMFLWSSGILYYTLTSDPMNDPYFLKFSEGFDPETQASLAAAERTHRMRSEGSFLNYEWNRVLGVALPRVEGTISGTGFVFPERRGA